MNRHANNRVLLCCFGLLAVAMFSPAAAGEYEQAKAQFAQPSRDYSTAPLWVWNDMLTEEEIVSTMEDLAGQQVKQVFVHPRPGLMTPYLGEDWFRLWKVALRAAQRLDMNVWIYDENSYPSGFAGGFVPEAMPESRGKRLNVLKADRPPRADADLVAVFSLAGGKCREITKQVRSGEKFPQGRYLVFSVQLGPQAGWYGGWFYVDLIHPGVVKKFIDVTMEAYRREIGDQFGKRVPGWFTDEPHLAPAGGLHWSDHLPKLFQDRWGYSLTENLPSLVEPVGDWRRVRHNYYQLLLEQFIECWSKPCYEYCEKHHLDFTGHYWEHGWPGAGHGGDNMAMYAWHQRPAIDCLMNDYQEGPHAQFGNARAVLELASAANQMGRRRTLCEAYGAGGWDLRFEDMKRIGDWLYVLGVNTLDQHLSYITIRGARKRDHPQSFSYHEPWWEAYHVMAQYFTRLSLVMSRGEQVNRILILEPTTTAWMYQGDKHLEELGTSFQALVTALAKHQVEFDLGSEDIIVRFGSVDGRRFVVNKRGYDTVVLPPTTENLHSKTLKLLAGYAAAGGTVLSCVKEIPRVDGQVSDRGTTLTGQPGYRVVEAKQLDRLLHARMDDDLQVRQAAGDSGILFHQRRRIDGGQFLLLVNTSIESPCAGTIDAAMQGLEQWHLEDGRVTAYPFARSAAGLTATFHLPPCGSLLLCLTDAPRQPAPQRKPRTTVLDPNGPPAIHRVDPNVLTIDYVDVTVEGKTEKNVYFYPAAKRIFQHYGLAAGDPWDSAVQFRDQLITKTFPAESGFRATYRFQIEGPVPKRLEFVLERPDLYTITVNGKPAQARPGAWWLDKSFGRMDIAALAKEGENAVTIEAHPLTIWHELEPAYVLGDFALKPTDAGFTLVAQRPLAMGSWKAQGLPLYGAGVSYRQTFDVGASPSGRYLVELTGWYGSVAKVIVDGQPAGYIAYRPWTCDVTDRIKPGRNTVEVVVIGTLKNTLGPHHAGQMVGRAWPSAFQQGPATGPPPGEKYHTLDYGLFEPAVLKRVQ